MSVQLTLDVGAGPEPALRRTATPKVAAPHAEARRAGFADGRLGERRAAHRWPSGTYGHADYELGFADGERDLFEADALGSYHDAVKACGERHKAGEPLGEFFQPLGQDV